MVPRRWRSWQAGGPARAAALFFAALCVSCGLAAAGRGDVLRILKDNREAALARFDLIQRAQTRLDLAYFAVGDDPLARSMLALLRDAARRGVRVRLIVDAMYNNMPADLQAYLLCEGVEIKEFHPISCRRPFWINRRMHDKVLVVDAYEAIIGSRNLDQRHFGMGDETYVDRDAYIRGEAARCAARYFDCLWASDEVRPTDTKERRELGDFCPVRRLTEECCARQLSPCAALDQASCELAESGCWQLDAAQDWGAGQPELTDLCFLHDDCGRKRQPGNISDHVLALIANARDSIILESPYLVVSRHLDKALAAAQDRGVCIVILTNSLSSTDQIMVYGGYSNQKKELLRQGVQLWEFAGPNHFHAKSALIDGCISIIGSYNFDHRSEHLNTETAVVTRDPIVAEALLDSMAENFADAWRIGPDGRPIQAASRHPGADRKQIRELRAARLVAPLIKRSL